MSSWRLGAMNLTAPDSSHSVFHEVATVFGDETKDEDLVLKVLLVYLAVLSSANVMIFGGTVGAGSGAGAPVAVGAPPPPAAPAPAAAGGGTTTPRPPRTV